MIVQAMPMTDAQIQQKLQSEGYTNVQITGHDNNGIDVTATDWYYMLTVRDNGPGFPRATPNPIGPAWDAALWRAWSLSFAASCRSEASPGATVRVVSPV